MSKREDMSQSPPEGAKVKLRTKRIKSRTGYKNLTQNYRDFIEHAQNKIFTVEYDLNKKKNPLLVCLKEDITNPKWLFWIGDLEVINVWQETISSITIVLENCEEVEVPVIKIKKLHIDDVEFGSVHQIHNFFITIKDADKFQRLIKHKDACAIKIKYRNGIERTYLLPYCDGGNSSLGAPNELQKTSINEQGDLELQIRSSKKNR